MCRLTSAVHPVCSSPAHLQLTQVHSRYATPPPPALATGGCSNPIQDTGTRLPCCKWLRPILHPGQTLHPSPSTTLCYCLMACYSLSARWVHLLFNKITTVCCPGSTMVELVMGIPVLLSEPDHLTLLSNKCQLFRLPNGSSFSTTSGFYNSAKFSNVLPHDDGMVRSNNDVTGEECWMMMTNDITG